MKKQPAEKTPAKKKPGNTTGAKKIQKKPAVSRRSATAPDWEQVFRKIGSPAVILSPDFGILSANDVTCRLTGRSEQELRGKKCWEIFHSNGSGRPAQGCPMVKLLASGRHETAEMEVAINNSIFLVSCTPCFAADGALASVIHIATDVTNSKRIEVALRESEDRFRELYENNPRAVFTWQHCNGDFVLVDCNRAAEIITEGRSNAYLGKKASVLYTHRPELLDEIRQCMSGGGTITKELVSEHFLPGRTLSISAAFVPPDLIMVEMADITERKRIEQDLLRQNQTLMTINQLALDFASLSKSESVPELALKNLMKVSGAVLTTFSLYDPAERTLHVTNIEIEPGMLEKVVRLMGKRPSDLKIPVTDETYQMIVSHVVGTRKTLTELSFGEIPSLLSTGIQKITGIDHFIAIAYVVEGELYGTSVLAIKRGQPDPSFELLEAFAYIIAVSLRRYRAEATLFESERKYRDLVENLNDIIFMVDTNGLITYVSPVGERQFGYSPEDLLGKPFTEVVHREDIPALLKRFEEIGRGIILPFEWRLVKKDGSYVWVRTSTRPVIDGTVNSGFLGVISDISREKQAEEALRESESRFRKMLEMAPLPLCNVDCKGVISFRNKRFEQVFGYTAEDVPSLDAWWLKAYPDANYRHQVITTWNAAVRRAEELGTDIEPAEYAVTGKNGVSRIMEISGLTLGSDLIATFIDRTLRTKAEQALRESEGKYRELYRNAAIGIFHSTLEGKFIDMNPALAEMLGYNSPEEAVTSITSIAEQVYAEPPYYDTVTTTVLETGGIAKRENHYRRRDGTPWYGMLHVRLVPDQESRPGYYEGFVEDISERKRAEKELRESEQRYRNIITDTQTGYFQIDTQGRFTSVNQAWLRMHGYSYEEEVLGKHFSVTQVDADQQAAEVTVEHLLQGENVLSGEFSRRMKDGTVGHHTFSAVPIVHNGAVVGLEGFLIDVTERRRAQDALRESEEKYRHLFSTMAEGNALHEMVYDASGAPVDYRILDVNPAFGQIIGLTREAVVGKTSRVAYHVDIPPFLETYARVVATGQPEEFEVYFEPMKKHFAISVYSPGKGRFATIFEDITERKQSEELRDRLIRNLAQKNAELDKFTYTVSHDLKSPLVALQAYLSLLEEDMKLGDTGQARADIIRIVESADKLENLITTLLSLSRSGRTVDTPESVSVTDIAREAAGILYPVMGNSGVTLVVQDSMPLIAGDKQRLVQAMTNLLDNAVKFMGLQKEPRVEVGVRYDTGCPVFYVRDNGRGINREDLPKVFGLFERFNPDVPGTGIGLATVKRIIEAHGGSIRVESDGPGKGTTVSFTLPPVAESGTDKDKSG